MNFTFYYIFPVTIKKQLHIVFLKVNLRIYVETFWLKRTTMKDTYFKRMKNIFCVSEIEQCEGVLCGPIHFAF